MSLRLSQATLGKRELGGKGEGEKKGMVMSTTMHLFPASYKPFSTATAEGTGTIII